MSFLKTSLLSWCSTGNRVRVKYLFVMPQFKGVEKWYIDLLIITRRTLKNVFILY